MGGGTEQFALQQQRVAAQREALPHLIIESAIADLRRAEIAEPDRRDGATEQERRGFLTGSGK